MNNSVRILAIALAVSVGLHLFFAGLWVAGRWRTHANPMAFGAAQEFRPHGMALGAMFHELPPEIQAQFRRQMQGDMGQMRGQIGAERAARKQVMDSLGAEPYDPGALDKALAALREAETARRLLAHGAIADIARKVTGEQRAAMRRGLEQMQSRKDAWRRDHAIDRNPARRGEPVAPATP
ncbi:MAG: periplasmic heavy metal sensor [Alphaproteobacteria bacterium]